MVECLHSKSKDLGLMSSTKNKTLPAPQKKKDALVSYLKLAYIRTITWLPGSTEIPKAINL